MFKQHFGLLGREYIIIVMTMPTWLQIGKGAQQALLKIVRQDFLRYFNPLIVVHQPINLDAKIVGWHGLQTNVKVVSVKLALQYILSASLVEKTIMVTLLSLFDRAVIKASREDEVVAVHHGLSIDALVVLVIQKERRVDDLHNLVKVLGVWRKAQQ